MSARLVPLSPGSAPPIPLQRPVLLIGRHPECDVRIDSPKISRRHCCIALAYDRVVVRDLGSRNGLRLNGLVVEEAHLRPGDELAVGHLIYRVEDLTAPVPVPAPSPSPMAVAPLPAPSLPQLPTRPNDDDDLIPLLD